MNSGGSSSKSPGGGGCWSKEVSVSDFLMRLSGSEVSSGSGFPKGASDLACSSLSKVFFLKHRR